MGKILHDEELGYQVRILIVSGNKITKILSGFTAAESAIDF